MTRASPGVSERAAPSPGADGSHAPAKPRPSFGRHILLSPPLQFTVRHRHESGHSGGRPRHAHLRGIPPQAQADGRDRRQADSLAHHEDLRPSRHRGFRRLPRLQGLHDQGVFLQLLPPHLRRDDRRADQPAATFHNTNAEPWRVTLVDTGESTHDGRPAEARRATISTRASRSASPTATASPTSTSPPRSPSTAAMAARRR